MATQGHAAELRFTPEQVEATRAELDRILSSKYFVGSKRCHDFLVFIVSRALQGDHENLAERFIGADLFGRPIDYDTKADSIVRVCANDVRRRLSDYHSNQVSPSRVKITLAAGTYVPEFHWTESKPTGAGDALSHPGAPGELESTHTEIARTVNGDLAGRPTDELTRESDFLKQRAAWRRVTMLGSVIAGVVILALAVGCLSLWYELRGTRQLLYPWQNSPAVAQFWSPFLTDKRDTDLVLSDSSNSLIQAMTNRPSSLREYLNRNYNNQLQGQNPEMTAALGKVLSWGLGSPGEFILAQHIMALDPAHQKIHLYFARKYIPDMILRDDVILVGSRYGNPWAELFDDRMNFAFDPNTPNEIVNRHPTAGEPRAYEFTSTGSVGYCVVAYLPNPDHNGNALLIQGSSAEPTQSAGDFLLSEAAMSGLQKTLKVSKFPYFEILLRTSWIRGTPIDSSIVAYRTYSDLH